MLIDYRFYPISNNIKNTAYLCLTTPPFATMPIFQALQFFFNPQKPQRLQIDIFNYFNKIDTF